MGRSTFSGPVKSTNGFIAGSDGTQITKMLKSTVSVTVAALAAAAEEDIDVTVAGATAGDSVIVTPLEATMEAGVAIIGAWVATSGTVTIRVSNVSGSSLTGSTTNWQVLLIRS